MSIPHILEDLDQRVLDSGDTMTGELLIEPFYDNIEGGQLSLNACTQSTNINGIVLDNYNGIFRIFGRPSADGTTLIEHGAIFSYNPYTASVGGGDKFFRPNNF